MSRKINRDAGEAFKFMILPNVETCSDRVVWYSTTRFMQGPSHVTEYRFEMTPASFTSVSDSEKWKE